MLEKAGRDDLVAPTVLHHAPRRDYTIARADVSFELNDNFKLRFDLDNIFDTYYIANSYADVWTMPGAPRNWRVTLSGRF